MSSDLTRRIREALEGVEDEDNLPQRISRWLSLPTLDAEADVMFGADMLGEAENDILALYRLLRDALARIEELEAECTALRAARDDGRAMPPDDVLEAVEAAREGVDRFFPGCKMKLAFERLPYVAPHALPDWNLNVFVGDMDLEEAQDRHDALCEWWQTDDHPHALLGLPMVLREMNE